MWIILVTGYSVYAFSPASGVRSNRLASFFDSGALFETEDASLSWRRPDELRTGHALCWHTAAFLARPTKGAHRDVFTAEFQVAADLTPRRARGLTNLSRTRDGDEDGLVGDGNGRIAFASRTSKRYRAIAIVDLDGEPASLTADWSKWQRLTGRITNYQRTSRFEGVGWRHFIFSEPAERLTIRFDSRALQVNADSKRFAIDSRGETTSNAVVVQDMFKAPPAMLAWAVDTARAVPWIGPNKIAWLEKHWFALNDWAARVGYVLSSSSDDRPDPIESKLQSRPSTLSDWPPPDVKPVLHPELPGEGKWRANDDPLFASPDPGPPLFYSTFLRIDPERPFAQLSMTAWDPARIELHMVAGVLEPVSTTGLRGTGEIPKDPEREHVSRLVGAFNGAFQALHGEWGMVVDRKTLLPPKPFGATVALLDDGRTAMGTWPNPGITLPPRIVDLRQNLLPLVEGGVINPYRLKWWGSAPPGSDDRVYTIRTALCLTEQGKLVYFFGGHLSAETLGQAMLATGCDYGVHLDMNPGHCGFEYYRIDSVGEQPELHRLLEDDSEAEGAVPGRKDLFFRSKKLVPKMRHMRFPRYIGRDPRDFFYLLRRTSIFDNPSPKAERWKPISPLPAFPVAAVTANLDAGLTLFKIDLRQTTISIESEEPRESLLAIPFTTSTRGIRTGLVQNGTVLESLIAGAPAIVLEPKRAELLAASQHQEGQNLIQGVAKPVIDRIGASVALSVDPNGFLVVARGSEPRGDGLFEALEALGGAPATALLHPEGEGAVYWLVVKPDPVPAWERLFPDVKPVSPNVWRDVFRRRGRLLDHGEEQTDSEDAS